MPRIDLAALQRRLAQQHSRAQCSPQPSAGRSHAMPESETKQLPWQGAEKGGRGKNRKETLQFSKMRLSQARSVLKHSRALAEDVLAKRTSLDEALKDVEEERRAGQSIDERMAAHRMNTMSNGSVSTIGSRILLNAVALPERVPPPP